MTWFWYSVPNWLLSRPFGLILSLWTQLTAFKTIWPDFITVYPIDSFPDHMTRFLHCGPNWLLSRPFAPILSLCTQLTPFKTIWTDFYTVYPICSIDSFQDHLTRFLNFVANWLLSRPYDSILSLHSQLTLSRPFDPVYDCVPCWLLSRPFDLILLK